MAVRIRKDGTVVCAAVHPAMPGDTYVHDGVSYLLTTEHKLLVTESCEKHMKHGLWWWRSEEPAWAEIDRWWEDK